MEEKVFFNSKVIDASQAVLFATSPAALYGAGLFETMRSYKGRIVCLAEHFDRLKRSVRSVGLKIPYSSQKLQLQIKELVKINKLEDAYVRLTVWKNSKNSSDVFICARKHKPLSRAKYDQGFSCMVSSLRQNEGSFLSQIKSTNYLFFLTAYEQALKSGFDEAIILNNQGYVAEASRANIFLVKNNEILTPKLENGCLDGITRRVVLGLAKKIDVACREASFTLQDLYNAQEVFLTNSLLGIMRVDSIEGIKISAMRGAESIIELLAKEYERLVKNAR
ncbi:MAG: aminotransferase class IV [Candidatus Omnitrophica bacterium]|nr:aminotransferase class IV [Candidatus Omnitrophota bacterium]